MRLTWPILSATLAVMVGLGLAVAIRLTGLAFSGLVAAIVVAAIQRALGQEHAADANRL